MILKYCVVLGCNSIWPRWNRGSGSGSGRKAFLILSFKLQTYTITTPKTIILFPIPVLINRMDVIIFRGNTQKISNRFCGTTSRLPSQ